MSREADYLLGTHDEEIGRLGLQHRVWQPRVLDAWRRAGFSAGQTLLDIGCGPGWATLDLAAIVGPTGRVLALERSRRFLDVLEAECARRGLQQVQTHELDLDAAPLPATGASGAWARWILTFMQHPRDLLERVKAALAPGAVFVLHEYFEYASWRLAPRSPEFEEFVEQVMRSWRASGGEPDIGRILPVWLQELGFELRELRPLVDVVPATSNIWQWPKAFVHSGLRRLVDLGQLDAERARKIAAAFAAAEAAPHTLMVTPAVLEIHAVRR